MSESYPIVDAPIDTLVEVYVESDIYGPVGKWERRTLRCGAWHGQDPNQLYWADENGCIRVKTEPKYTKWRPLHNTNEQE